MVDTQGQKAAKNGRIIENMLMPLFVGNGYKVITYKVYKSAQIEFDKLDKLVIYQYPFDSIYPNRKCKTEFVIYNRLKNREIRVECKWQQGSGSVDEKIPYLYLNAVFAFPESEIIIVMDGGGFDKSAKPWLVEQCKKRWLLDEQPNKTIDVMTIAEFTAFFNKELA